MTAITVTELKEALERHLLRYGDGPVCVETRTEVLDIVKVGGADKFEPRDDEPWSLVLIAEQDQP